MKAAVRLTSRHSRASAPRPHPSDAPFVCIAQCSHVAMHGAPCISLSLLLLQSFSVRGCPLVPPPLSRSRTYTAHRTSRNQSKIAVANNDPRIILARTGQPGRGCRSYGTAAHTVHISISDFTLARFPICGYPILCPCVRECTLHISLHTGHTDSRTHGPVLVDDPRCSPAWAPLPSPSPPPRLIG